MNKIKIIDTIQKKNIRIEDNFDEIGKTNFVKLALYAFQVSKINIQNQVLTSNPK